MASGSNSEDAKIKQLRETIAAFEEAERTSDKEKLRIGALKRALEYIDSKSKEKKTDEQRKKDEQRVAEIQEAIADMEGSEDKLLEEEYNRDSDEATSVHANAIMNNLKSHDLRSGRRLKDGTAHTCLGDFYQANFWKDDEIEIIWLSQIGKSIDQVTETILSLLEDISVPRRITVLAYQLFINTETTETILKHLENVAETATAHPMHQIAIATIRFVPEDTMDWKKHAEINRQIRKMTIALGEQSFNLHKCLLRKQPDENGLGVVGEMYEDKQQEIGLGSILSLAAMKKIARWVIKHHINAFDNPDVKLSKQMDEDLMPIPLSYTAGYRYNKAMIDFMTEKGCYLNNRARSLSLTRDAATKVKRTRSVDESKMPGRKTRKVENHRNKTKQVAKMIYIQKNPNANKPKPKEQPLIKFKEQPRTLVSIYKELNEKNNELAKERERVMSLRGDEYKRDTEMRERYQHYEKELDRYHDDNSYLRKEVEQQQAEIDRLRKQINQEEEADNDRGEYSGRDRQRRDNSRQGRDYQAKDNKNSQKRKF